MMPIAYYIMYMYYMMQLASIDRSIEFSNTSRDGIKETEKNALYLSRQLFLSLSIRLHIGEKSI